MQEELKLEDEPPAWTGLTATLAATPGLFEVVLWPALQDQGWTRECRDGHTSGSSDSSMAPMWLYVPPPAVIIAHTAATGLALGTCVGQEALLTALHDSNFVPPNSVVGSLRAAQAASLRATCMQSCWSATTCDAPHRRLADPSGRRLGMPTSFRRYVRFATGKGILPLCHGNALPLCDGTFRSAI